MSLTLQLSQLPADTAGIYKVGGVAGRMPARALFLHPDAAHSFVQHLSRQVVVSDVFRSAESSLAAVRSGRGAKPPGFSGHNYGLSIDIDVKATWSALKGPSVRLDKGVLDAALEALGWYCHRRDRLMNPECWHYNWLGVGMPIDPKHHSTAMYIEGHILALYGNRFVLDATGVQDALSKCGMYHGAIDGEFGPISREAVRVFQRAWGLKADAVPGPATQRTLAYVACDRQLVPVAL